MSLIIHKLDYDDPNVYCYPTYYILCQKKEPYPKPYNYGDHLFTFSDVNVTCKECKDAQKT